MPAAPPNKHSRLLEPDENALLFSLLGQKCVTMETTVAQLFYGDGGSWNHQATGVLCFVRDANARSFFLRFYDLDQRRMLFEQEIYRNMQYNNQHSFFHQVEADTRVVGFNFVDADNGLDEAYDLATALKAKVDKMSAHKLADQPPQMQQSSLPNRPMGTGVQQVQQPIISNVSLPAKKADNKKLKKERSRKADKSAGTGANTGRARIRREDIGTPTNFRHVQHVGYDNMEGGASIQREDVTADPVLKFLFGQIGEDFEQTMQTKSGQRKVEQFVNQMGGMDKVHQMASESGYAPPPGGGGGDLLSALKSAMQGINAGTRGSDSDEDDEDESDDSEWDD